MVRGIQSNHVLIREARERLGWTQERLATEATLSVRVVAKIESGGTVSRATLEKVAAAYEKAGASFGVDDLIFCAESVLGRFVINRSDINRSVRRAWTGQLARDASLTIPGEKTWMPLAGTHTGIAEFIDTWWRFLAMFENSPTNFKEMRQIARTADGAIAWGHLGLRTHPNSPPCLLLVRMRVRQGLIVLLETHFDVIGMRTRLLCLRPEKQV